MSAGIYVVQEKNVKPKRKTKTTSHRTVNDLQPLRHKSVTGIEPLSVHLGAGLTDVEDVTHNLLQTLKVQWTWEICGEAV